MQEEKETEEEKAKARVSLSEPEARLMKHGDNAIAPSYNAQISTESGHKVIVGAHLSQCSSDAQSLMPAVEEVERNLEKKPGQVVVDGGFTNRGNIIQCAAQGIDLIGSLPSPEERSEAAMKSQGIDPGFAPHRFRILEEGKRLQCPAGCTLIYVRQSVKGGDQYHQYQAEGKDCQVCRYQRQCYPKNAGEGRTVSIRVKERGEVAAFRKKMESEESKAAYRRRGEVAEFPNAWIKDKLDPEVPGTGVGEGRERIAMGVLDVQHHAMGAVELVEEGDGIEINEMGSDKTLHNCSGRHFGADCRLSGSTKVAWGLPAGQATKTTIIELHK
jgi:hypothetical protein